MSKALIIGGGVAGPVAAMALQRAGIEAVIYEAHPTAATDVGAFLTFAVNGMDALRAIDVNRTVIDRGFPTPTLSFRSGTGRELGTVPLGGSLADGTVTYTIKRADLYRGLHEEAISRGIRVEYGRRLVSADQLDEGRVAARFDDGSQAEGNMLIGCDGIHSTVRKIIDPHAPAPRYVPVLNTGGFAGPVDGLASEGTFEMMFGKRCFFAYAVHPDGGAWWFANPPRRIEPSRAEVDAITDTEIRAELHDLLSGDHGPWREIIDATPDRLRAWATYDIPTIPTWSRGSMIVIGDAAHATAPSSGQGASMAIEDAVVLAQCLRDHDGVSTAFGRYEEIRRDRVQRIVAAGARSSNSKAAGPIMRMLRDAMLPRMLKKFRDGDPKVAFMYDHHIEWEDRQAA